MEKILNIQDSFLNLVFWKMYSEKLYLKKGPIKYDDVISKGPIIMLIYRISRVQQILCEIGSFSLKHIRGKI